MKKGMFILLLASCSIAYAAEPEWEWVRAFRDNTLVFHISKDGLKETLQNKRELTVFRELYQLREGDIQDLLKKKIPTLFVDYLVEFGCGDGTRPDEIITRLPLPDGH